MGVVGCVFREACLVRSVGGMYRYVATVLESIPKALALRTDLRTKDHPVPVHRVVEKVLGHWIELDRTAKMSAGLCRVHSLLREEVIRRMGFGENSSRDVFGDRSRDSARRVEVHGVRH